MWATPSRLEKAHVVKLKKYMNPQTNKKENLRNTYPHAHKRQAFRCHHTHRAQTIHVGPQFHSLRVLIPLEILNMHHSYRNECIFHHIHICPLSWKASWFSFPRHYSVPRATWFLQPCPKWPIGCWRYHSKCNLKEHMKLMGTLHASQRVHCTLPNTICGARTPTTLWQLLSKRLPIICRGTNHNLYIPM